jgi:hypothetical protein
VTDGQNSDWATVYIEVTNWAPDAADDWYITAFETTLVVAAGEGVLANDSDADEDDLEVSLVSGPADGTLVSLGSDGAFEYEPDTSFTGTDSFTYEISDGFEVREATVYIFVMANSLHGFDDYYFVEHNTQLVVDDPGVLENDFDYEDDPLTASLVSGPANGTLTLYSDGSFDYDPDTDYSGPDSFVYEVTDGTDTAEATVYLFVDEAPGTNHTPVAQGDAYLILHDTSLEDDVLANDWDPDEDSLTASVVTGPANGTLVEFNSDGTFEYEPDANYAGPDSFVYEISDGTLTATAAVTIEMFNTPPFTYDEFYSAPHDELIQDNVLTNDSDADQDSLTAALLSGPTNGTLNEFNSDGSFEYEPDPDFVGGDSFTYTVTDGIATVTATAGIQMLNDPPVARDDQYTTLHDVALTVDPASVLDNDEAGDGDSLAASLVSGPANGTLLEFNSDGTFEYLPDEG